MLTGSIFIFNEIVPGTVPNLPALSSYLLEVLKAKDIKGFSAAIHQMLEGIKDFSGL